MPLIPPEKSPENAQEEPGLPLGSSGHRVEFWVTGLRVFGVRPENTLTSRKSASGSPGVHHRRIGLHSRIWRVTGRTDITASRSKLLHCRISVPAAPPIMEDRSSLGSRVHRSELLGSAPSLPISRSLCTLSPIALSLSLSRIHRILFPDLTLSLFDLISLVSQSHSLVSVSLLSSSLSVLG
jgi:hypothetical protein